MRTKCYTCLCQTCMTSCRKCADCKNKVKSCEAYNGLNQMSIFEPPPQQTGIPRCSWEHYGITKERRRQLTEYIRSGRYTSVARQAAYAANKDIAEYILLSVTQNKSYDALRVKWELKEMERIPYCRTDFYGIRRYFYYLFDLEVRKEECMKN